MRKPKFIYVNSRTCYPATDEELTKNVFSIPEHKDFLQEMFPGQVKDFKGVNGDIYKILKINSQVVHYRHEVVA